MLPPRDSVSSYRLTCRGAASRGKSRLSCFRGLPDAHRPPPVEERLGGSEGVTAPISLDKRTRRLFHDWSLYIQTFCKIIFGQH